MAVKKIPVPFCDWCKQPFLPKFRLKDGTRNPIFDHPEQSKRCGKCKRTGWNAGGVDRRRKKPEADQVPQVTTQDVIATIDMPEVPKEAFAHLEKLTQDAQKITGYSLHTRPVFEDGTVGETKTREITEKEFLSQKRTLASVVARRCRHGLYKCEKCHGERAA